MQMYTYVDVAIGKTRFRYTVLFWDWFYFFTCNLVSVFLHVAANLSNERTLPPRIRHLYIPQNPSKRFNWHRELYTIYMHPYTIRDHNSIAKAIRIIPLRVCGWPKNPILISSSQLWCSCMLYRNAVLIIQRQVDSGPYTSRDDDRYTRKGWASAINCDVCVCIINFDALLWAQVERSNQNYLTIHNAQRQRAHRSRVTQVRVRAAERGKFKNCL